MWLEGSDEGEGVGRGLEAEIAWSLEGKEWMCIVKYMEGQI